MTGTDTSSIVYLRHHAVVLALHSVASQGGDAHPLLVLHGLGESAERFHPAAHAWPGPVWALDFTGHGRSTVPAGGGYTAEVLMGDADIALAHLGPATVLGRGLGAYVALLIAGYCFGQSQKRHAAEAPAPAVVEPARDLTNRAEAALAANKLDDALEVAHLALVVELADDGLALTDRQLLPPGKWLGRADGPVVVGRQPGAHALEEGTQTHDVGRQGNPPSGVLGARGDGQGQFRRRA